MYCKKCGNELKDGSAFCTRCGAKVDGAQNTEAVKNTETVKGAEVKAAEAMSNAVPVQGSQQMVKTAGKLSKKAIAIAFACVAAVAALVVYGVNKNGETQETAAEAVDMEKHLAQPLYNIEGPGHISLKENVASPGSKEDGMTWDETLFYWLEDVDTTSTEDGNIASCLIYKTQLINDDNGNLIQYEIYKDGETKEVYKIVSIEQQTDGLLITDYYYDKGKINFIFERKESIYTPTYATTDKTGNRYYFNNDTMVRWRMINEPRVLEEYTLAMREVSYTQWHYFAEPADVQKKYDEKEQEMLNAAYNTYAAVADAVGIGTVEGNVTDTTNTPLEGITVSVFRQSDDVLLYQTKTKEDGSFLVYVNLDETECYMELVGTEEYKALTINDVTLGISDLVKSYNNLIMHKTGGDEYLVEVCVYSAENVVTKEEESTKGDKLLGATVTVREGAMNYDGDILTTAQADASGIIILNLKSGIYTLQIDIEGYETAYLEIEVNEQETKKDAYMIPSVSSGKTAVLLTWKDAETDLDLTLYTPYQAEGGDMAHIGAGTMEDAYGNHLISDNSMGCELMYLDSTALGNYKIYVNNYTDSLAGNYTSNALAVLEVHIYIYNENGLVTEYTFPAGQNGVVWEVAEISGSQVSSANRVYSSVEQGSIWNRDKELESTAGVLKLYSEFLRGNTTVNYQGRQISYDELVCDVYGCGIEKKEDYPVGQGFILTDSNQDNIPELAVRLWDLSYGGALYVIELIGEELDVIYENSNGYSESVTVYKRGMLRIDYGMSAVSYPVFFESISGETLAVFETVHSGYCQELTESQIAEDYDRWYNEGYEYVYVTSDDMWSGEEFNSLVDNYAIVHCGEEAEYYEIEEASIQNNMKWEEDGKEEVTEEVVQAYSNIIDLCEQEGGYGEISYDLIYLNNDDIPELVVHGSSCFVSVYTYADSKALPIIEWEPYGTHGSYYEYMPKSSLVKNTWHNMDDEGSTFYHEDIYVVNGNFEMECLYPENLYLVHNFEDVDKEGCYIGQREITGEQFDRYVNVNTGKSYEWLGGLSTADEMKKRLNNLLKWNIKWSCVKI